MPLIASQKKKREKLADAKRNTWTLAFKGLGPRYWSSVEANAMLRADWLAGREAVGGRRKSGRPSHSRNSELVGLPDAKK